MLQKENKKLAIALSELKVENASLFSQNVALVAKAHDLRLACKRRNVSIVL